MGLSVLVTAVIGRPGEVTAGITTASGVAVGVAAAWLGLRVVRPLFDKQTWGEYAR